MPNRSGKVGVEALIEDLRELADTWGEEKRMGWECANQLRAYLSGFEGGQPTAEWSDPFDYVDGRTGRPGTGSEE